MSYPEHFEVQLSENEYLGFSPYHGDCFVRNKVCVRYLYEENKKPYTRAVEYTEIERRTYMRLFDKPDDVIARYIAALYIKLYKKALNKGILIGDLPDVN